MSRRRDVELHRRSLGEVREIMYSMKTLAYMETRKLGRFLPAQRQVVQDIESMAGDFLHFHPELLPAAEGGYPVYLLVGTERGFCGDFNKGLLEPLAERRAEHGGQAPALIGVGHKLHALLDDTPGVAALLPGASVAEEVAEVLPALVQTLAELHAEHGALSLQAICHRDDAVVVERLLPPFRKELPPPPAEGYPPVLNLSPAAFLQALTDHYLFSALHALLYSSLMAENERRVAHLEGAVRHLDEQSAALARRANALRQEEIIEEIEVILLSSGGVDEDLPRAAE